MAKKYISKVKLPGTDEVYDITLPSDADLSINSVTANTFTGDLTGNASTATKATSADSATYATTAGTANSVAAGNISGTVAIGKGGTGATTAAGARTNLDIYSKSEVNDLISGIDQFEYEVVTTLPTASASTMHKIYLVAHAHATGDGYDEYITLQSGTSYSWEKIGNTDIDLSGYSKKTHKHAFTGSAGTVSVSGSYTKATGVTISTTTGSGTATYIPKGVVGVSRSADVKVSTGSVSSLSSSGTLPALSSVDTAGTDDIEYVKSTNILHSFSVSHSDPTFNSASINQISDVGSLPSLDVNSTASGGTAIITGVSKGGYTPTGSVSASFSGNAATGTGTFTPAGSVDLGSNTTETGGVRYVDSISSTGASASSTGTFVTGISGGSGSLTSNSTASGGIAYVTGVSGGTTSGTTKYMSFSAGSLPSYSTVSNIRTGGSTATGVNITGTVTDGVLELSAATSSAYLTGTSTTSVNSMTGTGSLPSMNFAATSGNAYISAISSTGASASTAYLHHGHTAASVSSTGTAVTGVSGGTASAGYKYFHPAFTGSQGSTSISITPSGTVSASFTGTKNTDVVTGGTTSYLHFGAGSLPSASAVSVLTGVKSIGGAVLTGGITDNSIKGYLHLDQGTLPSATSVTVATGISQQPSFSGTFTGTGAYFVGSLSTESATVSSSGSFTPSGTIGQADA